MLESARHQQALEERAAGYTEPISTQSSNHRNRESREANFPERFNFHEDKPEKRNRALPAQPIESSKWSHKLRGSEFGEARDRKDFKFAVLAQHDTGLHHNSNWQALNPHFKENASYSSSENHPPQTSSNHKSTDSRAKNLKPASEFVSSERLVAPNTIFNDRDKQKFKILSQYISQDYLDIVEQEKPKAKIQIDWKEEDFERQKGDSVFDLDPAHTAQSRRPKISASSKVSSEAFAAPQSERFAMLGRNKMEADLASNKHSDREQSRLLRSEVSSQYKSSFNLRTSKSNSGLLDQYLHSRLEENRQPNKPEEVPASSQRMKDSYVNSVLEKVQKSKSPLTKTKTASSSQFLLDTKAPTPSPQPQTARYQYTPREVARMSAQPQLAFPSFGIESAPQHLSMVSKGASAKLNSTNNDSTASSKLRIKVNVTDLAQRTCSEIEY